MSFVNLHNHSHYSLLDGMTTPEEMAKIANDYGQKAIAITDHGRMGGVFELQKACSNFGVKPIFGCLFAGQEIVTLGGIKNVEDIEVGDLVLSHTGRFNKVLRTMSRHFDGSVATITVMGRYNRKLKLTDEHPILVRDVDGNVAWKKPGEIDIGRKRSARTIESRWKAYVGIPLVDGNEDSFSIDNYLQSFIREGEYLVKKHDYVENKYYTRRPKKWVIPSEMSVDYNLCFFLGLYAAEGTSGESGLISLTFHSDEAEYAELSCNVLNSLSSGFKIYDRKNHNNTLEVVGCDVVLAEFFRKAFRHGAKNKIVPDFIFDLKTNHQVAFLEGLLAGDGKHDDSNKTLHVSSKNLAWGARTLAANLGIFAQVGELVDGSYTVPITMNAAFRYSFIEGNILWRPILDIEWTKESAIVYNFEVENDNSYVSDFILHNCEIYYVPSIEQDNEDKSKERFHLILLAKNQAGLEKMFKLQQKSWTKPNFYFKPRVDWSDLEFLGDDVIILSGCMAGQLARFLEAGEQSQASKLVEQFAKQFGRENYFIEIQPWNHGNLNADLLDLASSFDLHVVGTLDCHYPTMNDAGIEEMMLMMNQHSSLKPADDRYAKEHAHEAVGHSDIIAKINAMYPNRFLKFDEIQPYLMSFDEVTNRFGDLASIPGIFENTEAIADRCNAHVVKHKSLLPKYSKTFNSTDLLRELAFDGLEDLGFNGDDEYVDRLNFEIETIVELGYADYFLIVWDLCNYADKNGIARGPGRGSVCGSLLAYCLRITEVDPIEHGLLFSRFLNKERVSQPDIDLDFDSANRDNMKEYAAKRWGEDNVASISAYTVHKPKKAVKGILKVYNVPFKEANAITPLFETMDEFKKAKKIQDIIKKYPEIVSVVERMEGRICEDGVHAAGVVIADRPLWQVCPVESRGLRGAEDRKKTIALDMEQAEEIGLWKFDFLAITALDVIYNSCIAKIEELHGIDVRGKMKTYDDAKVLQNFNNDSLVGIFQAEGAGYKSLLEQMTIDHFNDLVASNALVRPGAMNVQGKDYINGKRGKLISVHPIMEPIVAETYNCVVYQEQLMKIVMVMADFTEGEADYLRKIIGKKRDPHEFERFEDKWMQGATRYISQAKAREMWRGFERASEYMFNKSHAVAYSMLSYWTMWLKTYYPKEFIWACLANETNATTTATLLNDAVRLGVKLLPPDVNRSDKFMSIDEDGIRFGLSNVASLGDSAAEEIIKHRSYSSFDEFRAKVSKSKVKINIIENLEKIGAFASVGHDAGFDAKKYYLPILNCAVYEEDDDRFSNLITPLSEMADSSTLSVVRGMVKSVKRKPNYFRVEMEDSSGIASFFAADRSADIKARDYLFAIAGASNLMMYTKDIEQDDEFRNFILSMGDSHDPVKGIGDDKRLGIVIGLRRFKTKAGRDMGECWFYDPIGQQFFKLTVFPQTFDKVHSVLTARKKLVVRTNDQALQNAIEYERYLEIAG